MSRRRVDREALVRLLSPVEPPTAGAEDQDVLERMSLAAGLLALARIDHEAEYLACRSVADHLLGDRCDPADPRHADEQGLP
jgi:hypothetical protein